MSEEVLRGADAVMAALARIAERMGGGHVDVGFMEHQTYPDGTGVAQVAFWNEFGQPEREPRPVPARPFFRRMIAEKSPDWPEMMAAQARRTDYNGPEVLRLMGEEVRQQLIESIQALVEPKLADSTIAKKGFDKPLIETGLMVQSVTYEVKE